jgi:hypothetical protein
MEAVAGTFQLQELAQSVCLHSATDARSRGTEGREQELQLAKQENDGT